MKQLGSHRNVLSMLGCWVKSKPIMLILEYVPHGDLLQWLRNKRQKIKFKNDIDGDVFEELVPLSSNACTGSGASKLEISKEDSPEETVKVQEIEEVNIKDRREEKTAEVEDDEVNTTATHVFTGKSMHFASEETEPLISEKTQQIEARFSKKPKNVLDTCESDGTKSDVLIKGLTNAKQRRR
ncbi:hypothetical protein OS493_032985 [Desmophyllum pertusum]|uniref:Serine-threonine/tyrosine-protein kinase catalytic domain-containing protein n=1 Tax=Desmophyllum pertusum TaxID=174260 RepID=A0A9W9ZWI4_9CNID|nr:hypothetical protein OS493_032985 [Desmophyllum pertusum]